MLHIPSEERLDKIPRLYGTYHLQFAEKFIYLHFFVHDSAWYIAEYDGEDTFYGFVNLNNHDSDEWCNFSFSELRALNISGVEVDCDPEDVWEIRRVIDIPETLWRK